MAWRTGRRYARVWWRFAALSVVRLLEYRVNVLLTLLEQIGQLALLAVMYLVIYRYTADVAGWSREAALLLLGVFWTFEGVFALLFSRGLAALPGLVRRGELDFVLLRPVAAQLMVTCWRGIDPREAGRVLQGAWLTVAAAGAAGVVWTPDAVLAAALFALCGLALLYALRFAIATGAFWVVQVAELDEVVQTLTGAARYPVTFFPEPVRALLTYVVPVAFAATFPAQALLGTADRRLLPLGVLLAGLALLASNRLWRAALRRYSSAGG